MILLSFLIMGSVIVNKYLLMDNGWFCGNLMQKNNQTMTIRCHEMQMVYSIFKLLFMATPYFILNTCFISTNIIVVVFCIFLSIQIRKEFEHIFHTFIIYLLLNLVFLCFISYNHLLEIKLAFLYRAKINLLQKEQSRIMNNIPDGILIHTDKPKEPVTTGSRQRIYGMEK